MVTQILVFPLFGLRATLAENIAIGAIFTVVSIARSFTLEIASGHFARLIVALHVVGDLLALDDIAHSGALDGGDMDEGVSAAIVRLNEAEAFCGIEPFNCASGHERTPS